MDKDRERRYYKKLHSRGRLRLYREIRQTRLILDRREKTKRWRQAYEASNQIMLGSLGFTCEPEEPGTIATDILRGQHSRQT